MEVKVYYTLPSEAIDIRNEVFVVEQGFTEEFDTDDKTAIHLIGFIDGQAVATSRILDNHDGSYYIGRIAVRKQFRKIGCGGRIIARAEEVIKENGGKTVLIHSQDHAVPFYEKQGYTLTGETDIDEGCPHFMLSKTL